MAAHPIVVVEHGKVEIPDELRMDPRFRDGAKLQLVSLEPNYLSEAERQQAWDDFIKLRGVIADRDYDPNAELEKEKQRELATERRWADQ